MKEKTITIVITTVFKTVEGGVPAERLGQIVSHEMNAMGMYLADNSDGPSSSHHYVEQDQAGNPLYGVGIDITRTET